MQNILEKGRDEGANGAEKTGSNDGLSDIKKKDPTARSEMEAAKARGVYVPFSLSVGVTSNAQKSIEQDNEELDIKEATRIDTKK